MTLHTFVRLFWSLSLSVSVTSGENHSLRGAVEVAANWSGALSTAPSNRRPRNFWNTSQFDTLQKLHLHLNEKGEVELAAPSKANATKNATQPFSNETIAWRNLTLGSSSEDEDVKTGWGTGDRRRYARRRIPGDTRRRRSRRRWEDTRRRWDDRRRTYSPPRRRRWSAPAPPISFGSIPESPFGGCRSHRIPLSSKCTGCPPMMDGKLCASTTWYEDTTRGSCGCGGRGHVDQDFWTLTEYTAAMNCANLDNDPDKSWCPFSCGDCYKLCSTGGATQGRAPDAGVCRVFKITNRCGDGYDDQTPDWCSQHMSWQKCKADPTTCRTVGNTNQFGYPAHFDLQDYHRQITSNTTGLDWDNAEVTFEKVSCGLWKGPSNVQCEGCSR